MTYLNFQQVPVLVTGATGKVGRHLVQALVDAGAQVAILTRSTERARTLWPAARIDYRQGDLGEPASVEAALLGIEIVFHLASYSPTAAEANIYAAPAHWKVSAEGTRNLMDAVLTKGVRRLVYLSSVKVMGDAAGAGNLPADETWSPAPTSIYGRAKLEAERRVLAAGNATDLHVCVLRLPMVYGLQGEGNIARLIEAVARHRFPPWPHVYNRRSAIHVKDAVRAAQLAAWHPRASGQIYLVTDSDTYSTRWLYEQTRLALGMPIPRWAFPAWMMKVAAIAGSLGENISGRAMPLTLAGLDKLTGNAWFNSEKLQKELGFLPQHHLQQEITLMASTYRQGRGNTSD